MNQKERIKAYEQQRQRADENKKKQGTRKLDNNRRKTTQTKNGNTTRAKVEKNVPAEKMGTSRKAQPAQTSTTRKTQQDKASVAKRQVSQGTTKKTRSQQANVRRQVSQSATKKTRSEQTNVGRQSQQLQTGTSKRTQPVQTSTRVQRDKMDVAKRQQQTTTTKKRATQSVARETVRRRTQVERVRKGQTEPLRAKRGPKAKNMSMEDVVKKVSQVSRDVKEGIQGAVYYIGTTLEKAKEREEREEREENYEENLWNDSQTQKQTVVRNASADRETQTKVQRTSQNAKEHTRYRKKQTPVQQWFSHLRDGKKFEITMTACAAILIVVVGGSAISSVGKSKDNSNDENNPIRNLINMMDFGNGKEDDADKTNDGSNNSNEDNSTNLSEETGITGNYTMLTASGKIVDISRIVCPSWIDRQFLTVNEYSRPGTILDSIESIVIHYVGNAGTTAQNNRNYFESLKDSHESSKSSHFVVGLEGEIIQCIPLNEKSYASNHRNSDTISIEVCHPDENGKFTDVTYDAVVKLTAWLCQQFDLSEENIIRHYDVTGKSCPKYFVDHEDAWIDFKEDVMNYMEENPDIK